MKKKSGKNSNLKPEDYHSFLHSLEAGFCIIKVIFQENQKPVDYRFLEISKSFEEQTGLINAQGKRMRELEPGHEDYWFEIYGKVALTGVPVRFENEAKKLNHYYHVFAARIGKPEEHLVAVLFNDIGKQKKAERELHESVTQFKLMGESVPYGVWSTDAQGNADYISPSFLDMVGMSLEEAREFGWIDKLLPQYREETRNRWLLCVRTGKDWEREHYFKAADGSVKVVLARGKPVRDENDRIIHWVGINLDITEIKKTQEELLKSLKENKTLIREIQHRTKNNLQMVSSLLNLQAANTDNEEVLKSLKNTLSRMQSISLLHNKLIVDENVLSLDLSLYLQDILSVLRQMYSDESRKVDLKDEIQSITVPVNFAINIGLIFNELITNSFKHAFSPDNEGTVTINVSQNENCEIVAVISDNGKGFNNKKIPDSSLGLKIIRSLVEQNKGNMKIISEKGTSFIIVFPLPNRK